MNRDELVRQPMKGPVLNPEIIVVDADAMPHLIVSVELEYFGKDVTTIVLVTD